MDTPLYIVLASCDAPLCVSPPLSTPTKYNHLHQKSPTDILFTATQNEI